jgi:hypothetical protein
MNNNKQSSVEWLINEHFGGIENCTPHFRMKINKALAMQQEQAQQYAEFCVMCDRNNLHLLDFESFILTYGGDNEQQ